MERQSNETNQFQTEIIRFQSVKDMRENLKLGTRVSIYNAITDSNLNCIVKKKTVHYFEAEAKFLDPFGIGLESKMIRIPFTKEKTTYFAEDGFIYLQIEDDRLNLSETEKEYLRNRYLDWIYRLTFYK